MGPSKVPMRGYFIYSRFVDIDPNQDEKFLFAFATPKIGFIRNHLRSRDCSFLSEGQFPRGASWVGWDNER